MKGLLVGIVLVLVAGLATCVAGAASAATIDLNGVTFAMSWTPAPVTPPGAPPVAGYEVWIARSTSPGVPPDSAFARELDVTDPIVAPVSGNVGDYVTLKVRGFTAGKALIGPFSPPSDQIRVLGFTTAPPPAPGQATVIVKCENPATPTAYIKPDGTPGCRQEPQP